MCAFRRVIIVLVVLLGGFFISCSGSSNPKHLHLVNWMKEGEKPRVLATTAIVGDLVASVGREHVELLVLMPSEIDPHSYEIVKGDREKFDRADVVFSNGLNLEHSQSMHARLHDHPKSIFLGDEVQKRVPSKIIYIEDQVDPHIWMDLSLWAESVDCIVQGLSSIDPAHAKEYALNGKHVKKVLLAKDKEVFARIQSAPQESRYLVTSHDAFHYFGRRYLAEKHERDNGVWLKRIRAIQGLAPDEQISPLEIIDVVGFVCSQKIYRIYPEMNLSEDALRKVVDACRKRGVQISLSDEALFGDTLGGKTYLEMFDYNVGVLMRGFSRDG